MSWKLVARAPKQVVQAALAAHEGADDFVRPERSMGAIGG